MADCLTIAQAHQKLAAKEVSAVELMQTCLDAINAKNDDLNAVVLNDGDRALATAKEMDEAGDFTNPLTGIPYLTKDIYCVAGTPSTACSNILRQKDYVPPFDNTTTKRLKTAGAISIGQANTDEFTMGASTETSCYGVTKNPWDHTRVAGGSSGGSAAGVAAGMGLFALGTDTGGSIRQPASFCNVCGLRPTYGRTSRYGVMSMASSLDTIGPLTQTIADLALVMEVIAGADPLDATTAKEPVPQYSQALTGDVKGLKIGVPKEYFVDGLNEEVDKAIKAAISVLQEQGATIVDISLPYTEYGTPAYYIICPSEVSSNMARYDGIRYGHSVSDADDLIDYYFKVRSEGFGDEVKRRIMIGTYALSAGYYEAFYRQAQKVRTLIKKDFEEAFKTVDAIVSPVCPTPAFKVGAHDDDPVAMYLEDIFINPQVMAGIPCLSVPGGFSKAGLPIGLQVMGPQWGEEVVLKVAHAYEQATEWYLTKT